MPLEKDIRDAVAAIFETKWARRDGKVIPDTNDVRLGNDAVDLDATVLYADMVDSTDLVNDFKDWFAAEVYKVFLDAACRIIRSNNGEITAFDGDRVMAMYVGDSKNSDAAKTALQINWVVKKVVNPTMKAQYPNTSFELKHAVGLDTSKVMAARTGIRGSNDLVWVGRAANYAAKLCSIRENGNTTFITEAVYNRLRDDVKLGGSPQKSMWNKTIWKEKGIVVYGSNWTWSI